MSTELQPLERAERALGFADRKAALTQLAKKSERIVEITNPAGYQECRAARMVLKNTRVEIQKVGKDARDDATKFSKAVIEKEKELIGLIEPEESRLQRIQDAHDAKVAAAKREQEEAEARRVEAIRAGIDEIRSLPAAFIGKPAADIAGEIERLRAEVLDPAKFAEQFAIAETAKAAALARLTSMHDDQVAHEAEQLRIAQEREELARLRAEQDERLRVQREAAEAERIEADRKAAEERGRLAKEAADKRAAEIAEQARIDAVAKAEREEQERVQRAQRAQEQAAEDSRLEAERKRQAEEARRLQIEREQIAADKAEQERVQREKELASVTLVDAATAAHALLISSGYSDHIATLKLGAALGRETREPVRRGKRAAQA